MEKIKDYKIGLRITTDIEDGKQLSEPYYAVFAEYEDGSVWFEWDTNTLEEAHEYVQKKIMKPVVDKYEKQIDDELFKATPDETIGFCEELITYLNGVKQQANFEKEQYK